MAYITVQINVPNHSVGDLNTVVLDATKSHEAVEQLINLLAGIDSGTAAASVQAVVSNVSQSITAAGGGNSATYNLL